jgi:hypothetical protein
MGHTRVLWLALSVLFALFLGASGGVLSWLGGMNPPNAVLAGAGAFAGTLALVLAVIHYLAAPEPRPVTPPAQPEG